MLRPVKLGAGTALLVLLAAACSSFTGADEPPQADGGAPDTSPDDDAHPPLADASSRADATDASDADVFPTTPLVAVAASRKFYIEAHEVTVAQYNLFKARRTGPLQFPAICPMKTTLGPPMGVCGARYADTDPVSCVDWCDADAYCHFIGRHLCGDLTSGGTLDVSHRNDTANDEWYYACRGPSGQVYPYGNALVVSACVTDAQGPSAPGSFPQCEGGFPGLFDMTGNLAEWVDSCLGPDCLVRGGSYAYKASDARCDDMSVTRSATDARADNGFRCCSETP